MPRAKKPICLECGKKRATWPKKQPTFCTQKCAAWYGFVRADDHDFCTSCEQWWDYYGYNRCPNCDHNDRLCPDCDLWYDYLRDFDKDDPGCPHCLKGSE